MPTLNDEGNRPTTHSPTTTRPTTSQPTITGVNHWPTTVQSTTGTRFILVKQKSDTGVNGANYGTARKY